MNWSRFYQKQIWYILVLEKRNEINQREIKAWRGLNSCLKIDLFCSLSKAQPGSCGRVQAQRGVHQHGCGRGSAVFCGHEAPLLQVTSTFVFLSLSLSSCSLFPSSCLLSVCPGKSILCKTNTSKSPILVDTNLVTWLWKARDAQRLTPGQFLAMWEVVGIKIERTRAHSIFFLSWHGNWQKYFFLLKRSISENFQWKKIAGASAHGILTHSGFRKHS